MGEPRNLHFYDFGIFGRVPEPQHQLILSLETPVYLNKSKKIQNDYFSKHHKFGSPCFVNFRKDGRRQFPTNPFSKILKTLDMGSITIKTHEMDIW